VEPLGAEPEDRKRRRLAKQGKLQETGATEEWPKLLPLSFFSETDSIEAKMDLCYAAFEDLLVTHDAEATGKGVVWMVRSIVREINDVLSDNLEAKQAFCMRLKRHPWFEENNQLVRWQESKQIINVSKISAQGDAWRQWNREQRQNDRAADRSAWAEGKAQRAASLQTSRSRKIRILQAGPTSKAARGWWETSPRKYTKDSITTAFHAAAGVPRMVARPACTLMFGLRADRQSRAQCDVVTAIARTEAKPRGKGTVTRLPWRSCTRTLAKHLPSTGWVPRPAAPWTWQHAPLRFEPFLDCDSQLWHGFRPVAQLLQEAWRRADYSSFDCYMKKM
ncbi:unnamed protein product, partial [Prorocentrum cordatum]